MSMNGTIRGTRGGNLRNGRTTFPQVLRRQEAAKARQEESSKRTPEEQLKRLDAAGLAATKERAKLAKRIADREAAKKAPPPETKKSDAKSEKKSKVAKGQARVAPTP